MRHEASGLIFTDTVVFIGYQRQIYTTSFAVTSNLE